MGSAVRKSCALKDDAHAQRTYDDVQSTAGARPLHHIIRSTGGNGKRMTCTSAGWLVAVLIVVVRSASALGGQRRCAGACRSRVRSDFRACALTFLLVFTYSPICWKFSDGRWMSNPWERFWNEFFIHTYDSSKTVENTLDFTNYYPIDIKIIEDNEHGTAAYLCMSLLIRNANNFYKYTHAWNELKENVFVDSYNLLRCFALSARNDARVWKIHAFEKIRRSRRIFFCSYILLYNQVKCSILYLRQQYCHYIVKRLSLVIRNTT